MYSHLKESVEENKVLQGTTVSNSILSLSPVTGVY